jgi:hypothetical protein
VGMSLHHLLQWLGCICDILLVASSCLIPPWHSVRVTCDLPVVCHMRGITSDHTGLPGIEGCNATAYWNSFGKLTSDWAFSSDVCVYLRYTLLSCWEGDSTHAQDTSLFMCNSPLAISVQRKSCLNAFRLVTVFKIMTFVVWLVM